MRCVVLSGATVPFTELVSAIGPEFVSQLAKLGFTELFVQYGHAQKAFTAQSTSALQVQGFDFRPQIKELAHSADLVISHAGSGSILDSLDRGYGTSTRKVIVVVNDKLMDNHQIELATKLQAMNCIAVASPNNLYESVSAAVSRNFNKLEEGVGIQTAIDALLE